MSAIIYVKNRYRNFRIKVTRVQGTGDVRDLDFLGEDTFSISPDSDNKVTISFEKVDASGTVQPITHDDPIMGKSTTIFLMAKPNETNWVLGIGYSISNFQSDAPDSTTDDPSTTNVDIGTPQ